MKNYHDVMNNSYENFQYNSCVSRGICTISPQNSALQTVLVLYLSLFSNFAIKLDNISDEIKDFILDAIAITIFNPDINEKDFIGIINKFKIILSEIIEKFDLKYPENSDFETEKNKASELLNASENLISTIQFGEKIFYKVQKEIPILNRDLYSIILLLCKSISINILDLKSFDKKMLNGFSTILELLNLINIKKEISYLKSKIKEASKFNIEIMKHIRIFQEERYGNQIKNEVSFSTFPNKAVLVVGSNIRELETILENLKEVNVDIYTHDDMMLAHTFPKFLHYEHLKGQYGLGIENCLLDFATFPGPIILTKNSLHNIENLYRGHLFTTDKTSPKGVINVDGNDFSEVIDAANKSKGFKSGKQCESIEIGYDKETVFNNIETMINTKKIDKIFLIGLDGYSLEQKTYFEKLIKYSPENILIISFSYNYEKDNLIHINACFDSYSIIRIYDYVKTFGLDTFVFMPKCDRNTISQMIYISENNDKIFVGRCIPIVLNPSLMQTLQNEFKIRGITSAKKDLDFIMSYK